MKKKMTLEQLCIRLFTLSMACIMQYVLAYVPLYAPSPHVGNFGLIAITKMTAVIFPVALLFSLYLIYSVKKKKMPEKDYVQFVEGAALAGMATGSLSAYSTYADAEKKIDTINKYPLFYPFGVFGYFAFWYFQVLFCFFAALTGKWTVQDILMNWQWDLLIFGGSGFLIATFVISCKCLYLHNGKKELKRQLLIVSALFLVLVAISTATYIGLRPKEKKTIHIYTYTPKVTDVVKEDETSS